MARTLRQFFRRSEKPPAYEPSPLSRQIAARAETVHRYMRRRRSRLSARTEDRVDEALRLLPFLLHVNQSGLPGYVDDPDCPTGVADYSPSSSDLKLATRLFPAARVRRTGMLRPTVDLVAVMGSAGTIGFTAGSDLDVWVCHAPSAKGASLESYRRKVEQVEAWCNEHSGVEVHLFLQATARIRDNDFGETDVEGCGSAMGALLKEEFYRTAILLGGRMPTWWVTPPHLGPDERDRFLAALRTDRDTDSGAFVDLGWIAEVPVGELFGAALWQIVKGWKSPFKSALKMGMMERAVRAEDAPLPLCEIVKKHVFSGEEPDPYCLLFEEVYAHYHDHGAEDTADLLARCFYLKAGQKVEPDLLEAGTRRIGDEGVIARYVCRWGWARHTLEHLNEFGRWRFEEVEALAKELDRYFLGTYQRLRKVLDSSGETQHITARDLTVLGRKLQTVYRRAPHKVQKLHLATTGLEETILTLYQEVEPNGEAPWRLYRGRVSPSNVLDRDGDLLRTGPDPVEPLVWAAHNHILGPHTVLRCHGAERDISAGDTEALARLLVGFEQAAAGGDPPLEALLEKPNLHRMVVVPNFGRSPGKVREVAAIHTTTWGETFYRRWGGAAALSSFLEDAFLPFLVQAEDPGGLQVFTPARQVVGARNTDIHLDQQLPAIARSLGGVFPDDLRRRHVGPTPGGTFVIDRGGMNDLRYRAFAEDEGLLRFLSAVGPHRHVETRVEKHRGILAVLERVFEVAKRGRVDVFVHQTSDVETLLVVDEVGHLCFFRHPTTREPFALAKLLGFLEGILPELAGQPESPLHGRGFHEALRVHTLVFQGTYRALNTTQEHLSRVRALGLDPMGLTIERLTDGDRGGYRITWGMQTIESGKVANPLAEARRRIRETRRSGLDYDVFVTRLFLDDRFRGEHCGPFDTAGHYLFYKKAVEQRLKA